MGQDELTPVLRARDLSVGYTGRPLASAMGFELRAGEVAALIGLNGSGKSTLLRTLAGLLPPLAGQVEIGGARLDSLIAQERSRRISAVLPARPRLGLMQVRALVELGRQPWTGAGGRLKEQDRRIVEEALEATGMTDLQERAFDTLSDGEAQKAMIARALAQDTPVMLLDEPTAHLDLVNRVTALQMLRTITDQRGRAIILSAHDLAVALDLCDRILLLHDGTLWSGSPKEAMDTDRIASAFERDGMRFDPATGALRPLK